MRPLRLSLTAFGPYAGTEVVDFDALTELGLFVVAGNNGAGKTTIFDALHYSLFGTLPGRRSTYIRLKSDHADDTAECSVSLDFTAHGKLWRVERSPKQKRPKRRGTGFTEVDRRATLYRLDQGISGPATAVANKIGEVDDQCRQLVGLSGKQFERVALLPQGEFSRVLRESSTDRRELLRTLFSSEIFGDATTLLNEQAAAATAADRSILERLDHQQASIAESLAAVTRQPASASASAIQASITDYRRVQIGDLTRGADELKQQADAATTAHREATDITARLQRRSQVESEHHQLLQGHEHHQLDIARLERGRAAVPVVNLIRATAEQEQRQVSATERVAELHQRFNRALNVAGSVAVETLSDQTVEAAVAAVQELAHQLQARTDAAANVSDLDAAATHAQGELRRILNQISNLDEQMVLARSAQRQLQAQAETLDAADDLATCEHAHRAVLAQLHQRTELAQLEAKHQTLIRRLSELDASIAQVQIAHENARQAQTALPGLQAKADTAFELLQAATNRKDAAQSYAAATTRLTTARTDHSRAQTSADQLWDAFIAGTAARVAEALVDDEPCPVCGSAEHPEPATVELGDQVVSQAQVTTARDQVDQFQIQVRSIQAEIEALRAIDPDIASLAATEAAAEIATAKAMALGARSLADDARQTATHGDALGTQLEQARHERIELDTQARSLEQRCNQLRGALGELVHQSVESLDQQAHDASAAVQAAAQRAAHQASLAKALDTAEADIDAIGLRQIAAEARRSAVEAQTSERRDEHDRALIALANLDRMLASNAPPHIDTARHDSPGPDGRDHGSTDHQEPASHEQRARAARHGIELGTELTAAAARQHEADQGLRRATALLDDRIGQSPFPSTQAALDAYVEPHVIDQLEAQTAGFIAADERLRGQLHELADLPSVAPDLATLQGAAEQATQAHAQATRELITATTTVDRLDHDLHAIIAERESLQTNDLSTRRLERVAALVKGDNDRNTSLENWVLAAHLRDVVELANIRLARSTHQRFQLCVLDDGENKRGKWGLDLGVEDTVTGTRRPTAGLSGGELFQASLALALGLADAVMNQSAGVRIDALFIDEGFGSLDEVSVERAIDLLDELRDRGAMVGVITHVPALLDALPLGVSVEDAVGGQGSTIRQANLAA